MNTESNIAEEDTLLSNLVMEVARSNIGFPITLTVGGILVSGTLVSGRYFLLDFSKKCSDVIDQFIEDSVAVEDVRNTLVDNAERYTEINNDEDQHRPSDGMIYLMDVRFFAGNSKPIPNNDGCFWRGKLSSVDGFMLGTLEHKP